MDIDKAKKIVINIGASYFYDELDRFSVDEIIKRITKNISQSLHLQGLYGWKEERDAYLEVIRALSGDELDNILFREYALRPEQVGGSGAFFQRLAAEIDDAIRQVKPSLVEKAQHETPPPETPSE